MIRFAKAHAYGNDFLYVDRGDIKGVDLPSLARQMCERHTGIGADGLIVYGRTAAGATMELFNADGGRAEVSGNGVRALAALLLLDDDRDGASVTITTAAGPKRVTRAGVADHRPTFRTAMGLPDGTKQVRLEAAGESVDAVVMNFGNPQCIVLGAQPTDERFHRLGAALETHQFFPASTNVEFATVESPDTIRIRIWERGVGPTMSSGTGSCASFVAAVQFAGAARDGVVIAPGGAQRVEWRDDSVYLTGWAEVLAEGEWFRELPR
ncbi:MAG TPA: diaminopimelate epimerase [Vicinamibacterales bacterium]|nr:diaminopimelate epimerase [Vicinamibacterales bacterium]